MKKILIYHYMPERLSDFLKLINYLEDSFIFIFVGLDKKDEDCFIMHGVQNYIIIHDESSKYYVSTPRSVKLMNNKRLKSIRKNSLGQLIWQELFYRTYQYYYKVAIEILKSEGISLLCVMNDRRHYFLEVAFVKAARYLGIKILLPYIVNFNAIGNLYCVQNDSRFTIKSNSSLFQKLVFKKFKELSFKKHYTLHAFMYVALARFEALSTMPWLNGAGLSDMLILPNEHTKKMHLQMGIDPSKIHILSEIAYIDLYKSYKQRKIIKNNIIKKYKLTDKKIMIVGLANWLEHNVSNKDTHWKIVDYTISNAIRFSQDYTIFVSLHPSMKLQNYKFLEKKYNIIILKEKLVDILPIASIYIADQSTTVPWAILCGIKTLMIACFKNLGLYTELTSLKTVTEERKIYDYINYLNSNKISFKKDWEILSRDKIFNDEIINQYKSLLRTMMVSK